MIDGALAGPEPEDLRHSRQLISKIGGRSLDQAKIKRRRVAIVGAGVLGSAASLGAAACGISADIFDFDSVSIDSLGKSVAFMPADVGLAKARVLARQSKRLDASLRTRGFVDDVLYTVGGGTWERYDALCVLPDNDRVRVEIASLGLQLPDGPDTVIEAGLSGFNWSVQTMGPHCVACGYDNDAVLDGRQSCNGIAYDVTGAVMPTTLPAALSAAGVIIQELLLALSDQEPVFRGREARAEMADKAPLSVTTVSPRPSCTRHRRLDESEVLRIRWRNDLRVGAVRSAAARALGVPSDDVALVAPRDVLSFVRCLECGARIEPHVYVGRYAASICSSCGDPVRTTAGCACGAAAPAAPRWPRLRLECPGCRLIDPTGFELRFGTVLSQDNLTVRQAGLPALEIVRAITGGRELVVLPARLE